MSQQIIEVHVFHAGLVFFQRKTVPIEVNRGILKGSALNDGNEAWPCPLMTFAPHHAPENKSRNPGVDRLSMIFLIGPAHESQVRIGTDMNHLSFKLSRLSSLCAIPPYQADRDIDRA